MNICQKNRIEQLAQMDNKYSSNYSTFKYAIDGDKVIPCSLCIEFCLMARMVKVLPYQYQATGEISCISKYFEMDLYKAHSTDFQKKIMILSTRNSKTARCLKPNVKKISQTRGEVQ